MTKFAVVQLTQANSDAARERNEAERVHILAVFRVETLGNVVLGVRELLLIPVQAVNVDHARRSGRHGITVCVKKRGKYIIPISAILLSFCDYLLLSVLART